MLAGGQPRVEVVLLGGAAQLVEPGRLAQRGQPFAEIGERAAPPQPEGPGERGGRPFGLAGDQVGASGGDQTFETVDVEIVVAEPEAVAAPVVSTAAAPSTLRRLTTHACSCFGHVDGGRCPHSASAS